MDLCDRYEATLKPTCRTNAEAVERFAELRSTAPPKMPADLAYERFARAGLRSDGYRFVIPGIRHSGVSDLPELAGAPVLRGKLGMEAALTTFTTIQNDLVRGFLDRHVKGAPSDFPAQALATRPELIVQDLSWLRERAQSEFTRNCARRRPNERCS